MVEKSKRVKVGDPLQPQAYVHAPQAVLSLADSYEKAAGATKVEWLATVATAQADFTRDVTKAYAGAGRAKGTGSCEPSPTRATSTG